MALRQSFVKAVVLMGQEQRRVCGIASLFSASGATALDYFHGLDPVPGLNDVRSKASSTVMMAKLAQVVSPLCTILTDKPDKVSLRVVVQNLFDTRTHSGKQRNRNIGVHGFPFVGLS
jgi:hypothetical protein